MEISLQDATAIAGGICHLQNYRLSANVTMTLAKNLEALKNVMPDADVERARILNEVGNPSETDPRFKEFVEKFNLFTKTTKIEVDFEKIRFEQLNVGEGDRKNHIAPALIAQLLPLIDSSGT